MLKRVEYSDLSLCTNDMKVGIRHKKEKERNLQRAEAWYLEPRFKPTANIVSPLNVMAHE